ncbi:MAG TPA: UDP-glucose--hexose-1-phosphate uridylyltransferase [Bacteroidales bacterium]|nr:UDP-glucose--hexose-1-phosphate uridylyltransferase [Bacteroidales bacterium]
MEMLQQYTHRRYNALTGDWVLVAPHRTKRPWQGQQEENQQKQPVQYDPQCYLCPGNTRANGEKNPDYRSTYTFVNDFSSLIDSVPDFETNTEELLVARSEKGICKVVCFSPRHDLTLAEMSVSEIEPVIRIWREEYKNLGELPFINYVQIFENRGEIMGASNPHPHGQIWSQTTIPVEPAKEQEQQRKYLAKNQSVLLLDYLNIELEKKERIIHENAGFVVLVPFWAVWPYETMILPKRKIRSLLDFTPAEVSQLADALKILTVKYDNLFKISFPYSAGIHQSPTDGVEHPEWQFHMHFYPPLLRSATIKKFMVGYEMLGNPQRDITAETSAQILRDLPVVHWKA